MEAGETTVRVGDSPVIGPARIYMGYTTAKGMPELPPGVSIILDTRSRLKRMYNFISRPISWLIRGIKYVAFFR